MFGSGFDANTSSLAGNCMSPKYATPSLIIPGASGAPVSDPACWRGTLDRAGSETGAPVAVIRRASFRAAGFSPVQRFMGGFDRMLPGALHSV